MADLAPWPRVIVVTDRHRLIRQVSAPATDWPELLMAQIAGCLAGGADLVQVREPDLDAGPLRRFLARLFDTIPGSAARVVVNDRVDVAWVTGAAGVHLTERSLSVADVRSLVPADKKWVIGRSVHDPVTAAASGAASYLVAGTVHPSESKPAGWGVLGWEGLAEIVQAAVGTPVVAIGGLQAVDVPTVIRSGAVGVAGIGWFLPTPGADIASSVQDRVRRMRNAFDTVGGETYTRSAGG